MSEPSGNRPSGSRLCGGEPLDEAGGAAGEDSVSRGSGDGGAGGSGDGGVRWQRPDTAGLTAAEVVAYLLARCPWGAAQTHTGLQKHLIEETHELIGALDAYAAEPSETAAAEVEAELGDVLYQVLFHAALLDRSAAGGQELESMDDLDALPGEPVAPEAIERVEKRLTDKIIRRHPHVFDSTEPVEIAEVERRYEAVKAAERAAATRAAAAGEQGIGGQGSGGVPQGSAAGDQASAPEEQSAAAARASFDSLPASVPALTRAQAVLGRIERLELDPPPFGTEASAASGAGRTGPDQVTTDPEQATAASGADGELGRRLFALVAEAQQAGLDAEAALRRVTSEVEDAAVEQARKHARQEGGDDADRRTGDRRAAD